MTHKERIEELERRLQALEASHPEKHVPRNISQHEVTTFTNCEAPPLPELTADETAFLKEFGIPPEQKTASLLLHQEHVSSKDRRTIAGLRKKRGLQITWHQPQTI